MRAWLTLTTPVCGLSSSASLTAHYALPVHTDAIREDHHMSESTDIELLHRAWEAMSGAGDLSVLEGALDPGAQWHGVEDGQICENRKMILTVMKRNLDARRARSRAEGLRRPSRRHDLRGEWHYRHSVSLTASHRRAASRLCRPHPLFTACARASQPTSA